MLLFLTIHSPEAGGAFDVRVITIPAAGRGGHLYRVGMLSPTNRAGPCRTRKTTLARSSAASASAALVAVLL
jgi:hypothetical protein